MVSTRASPDKIRFMRNIATVYLQIVAKLEEAGLDLKAFKILLTIAKNKDVGILELAKKAGVAASVCSRYVDVLSGGRPKVIPTNKALVLVSAVDYKTKAVHLTDRGTKLIKELGECISLESE